MKTLCFSFSLSLSMLVVLFLGVNVATSAAQPPEITGPAETAQQRIKRIGSSLVRFNSASHVADYVFIHDEEDEATNAWAEADGEILMTKKFYAMFAHSDEELAFFLAHEIAHVNLDHYEGKQNLEDALNAIPGSSEEEKKRKNDLKLSFDRQQEASADKYAILYLVRSGYSSMASVRGFLTLKKHGVDYTPHKEKRAHHPTTSARIENSLKMITEISEAISQYEYGMIYLSQGKYGVATDCFLEFLEMFPSSKEGNTNLGVCYSHLATAAMSPPEYLYTFSLPKLDTGYFLKGMGMVSMNPNYPKALKVFKKALDVDPGYSEALNNMGLLYTLGGETVLGLAYLKKAVDSDRENALYANNLGFAATQVGNREEALTAFRKAAEDTDLAIAQYNMGRLLWQQGEREEAVSYLSSYLAIESDGTVAQQALAMLGQPERSEESEAIAGNLSTGQLETALAQVTIGSSQEKLMAIHGSPERISHLNNEAAEVWHYFDNGLSVSFQKDDDGEKKVQRILGSVDARTVIKTQKGVQVKDSETLVVNSYGQPEMKLKEGPYEIWSYNNLGLGFFMGEGMVKKIYVGAR